MQTAIIGINPKTKCVDLVSIDEKSARKECEEMGLIIVPCSIDKARRTFDEKIDDIYSLLS